MVVRFLAAVSLLLLLVVAALLGPSEAVSLSAPAIVSVAAPARVPAPGAEECELRALLAEACEAVERGLAQEIVLRRPGLSERLMRGLAGGRLEGSEAVAEATLLALGLPAREAAWELRLAGCEAERDVAQRILDQFGAPADRRVHSRRVQLLE